jgi:hypothetical protein
MFLSALSAQGQGSSSPLLNPYMQTTTITDNGIAAPSSEQSLNFMVFDVYASHFVTKHYPNTLLTPGYLKMPNIYLAEPPADPRSPYKSQPIRITVNCFVQALQQQNATDFTTPPIVAPNGYYIYAVHATPVLNPVNTTFAGTPVIPTISYGVPNIPNSINSSSLFGLPCACTVTLNKAVPGSETDGNGVYLGTNNVYFGVNLQIELHRCVTIDERFTYSLQINTGSIDIWSSVYGVTV